MTLGLLFLIVALVLFVVAAAGVAARFNLVAAGLACVTLYLIAGGASL